MMTKTELYGEGVCERKSIIGKRGIFIGQPMELRHIMDIMLYCNYDELQRMFHNTYHKVRLQISFQTPQSQSDWQVS